MNQTPDALPIDGVEHVVVALYETDYRAAYESVTAGEGGTWFGHPAMVGLFSELAAHHQVTVLTCRSPMAFDERLPDGTRVVGTGFAYPQRRTRELNALIEELAPSHVVLRLLLPGLYRWLGRQRSVRSLALLADSFEQKGLRSTVRRRVFARRLNHPSIEWVGNHQLPASRSLAAMGVDADKIVPWDFPREWPGLAAKEAPEATAPAVFYAGSLLETKGIGDLVEAVALLRAAGTATTLRVAGGGDPDAFERRARELGIADNVSFLGKISHRAVQQEMRAADLVAVPSRHEYPEGFPFTIQEALSSRTPVLASDHPMFRSVLRDAETATIFPAGDPHALAAGAQATLDPRRYAALSEASHAAWSSMTVDALWRDVVIRWLRRDVEDVAWLGAHTLASGRYDTSRP